MQVIPHRDQSLTGSSAWPGETRAWAKARPHPEGQLGQGNSLAWPPDRAERGSDGCMRGGHCRGLNAACPRCPHAIQPGLSHRRPSQSLHTGREQDPSQPLLTAITRDERNSHGVSFSQT